MRVKRPSHYVVANFVLWALTYLIITARVMMDAPPHPGQMAFRRLILATLGFVACVGIGRVLAALAHTHVWRRLVAAVGLSTLGGLAYSVTNYVVFHDIWPLWGTESLTLESILVTASLFFWTFLSWCALFFAIRYEEESKAKDLRLLGAHGFAATSA